MIKSKLISYINSFSKGKKMYGLYTLSKKYLKDEGWLQSYLSGASVDKEGNELPWITYACIHFLTDRIKPEYNVFEYGSGSSTIWLAKNFKSVVSVENSKDWYDLVSQKLIDFKNVKYLFRDLDSDDYEKEILNYSNQFEVVFLDGRRRVQCCINSLNALKETGIIIWDNANRERYEDGYQFLFKNNFRRIDFNGLSPISTVSSFTSIFYRSDNCLGI